MDLLLIAVLVLVLLLVVAAGLLLRRLEQLQARLQPLAHLPALDGQLRALTAQVERREFSVALQAKLTELGESQARLAAAVAALQEGLAAAPLAVPALPDADLLGIVRAHLHAQHFESVRVLTDTGQLPDRSGRVAFEARRDGVLHKGHALLQDGVVVEESSHAAWSTFP